LAMAEKSHGLKTFVEKELTGCAFRSQSLTQPGEPD
jgi:hypothetical protein